LKQGFESPTGYKRDCGAFSEGENELLLLVWCDRDPDVAEKQERASQPQPRAEK